MAPDGDVLERVRAAAAWVAGRARHVHIDQARLAEYAVDADHDDAGDAGAWLPDDVEAATALVVQLDTVNFGSGWHPVLRKAQGRSGSVTISTAFRARAEREGVLRAAELARLTPDGCARILGQDAEGEAGELMALFARSLGDLGRFVTSRFGGSFTAMVGAAGGSAARLVEILLDMPLYRDIPAYLGHPVPLLKRAQITVHDLGTAFGGEGLGRFTDVDRLTMFADNLVPHVLRVDGVLTVDPTLAARIERGELLAYGSPEEVELRAVALHAVELLARRTGDPPRRLDERLWRRGGEPRYKAVPRPRCSTTAY
jgi:Potential Queuosine, Q, salvage protein family